MKKKYIKPISFNNNERTNGLVPALAAGAALAGGYIVGRVVKSIEVRPDEYPFQRRLKEVIYE